MVIVFVIICKILVFMNGKLVRAKSVLWCSHCRIHRNVGAPLQHHGICQSPWLAWLLKYHSLASVPGWLFQAAAKANNAPEWQASNSIALPTPWPRLASADVPKKLASYTPQPAPDAPGWLWLAFDTPTPSQLTPLDYNLASAYAPDWLASWGTL
jgi:hypothetical protein